jgi:hypothetical protein
MNKWINKMHNGICWVNLYLITKYKLQMNYNFDYVIVGAGPCGLTLAYIINQYRPDKKILLMDRERALGGCHRVRRVGGDTNMFTEHGPRIYLDNYLVFRQILNELGTDFYHEFVRYHQQFMNASVIKELGFSEILSFVMAYIKHFVNEDSGRKVILDDWMRENGFSNKIRDLIDRACRVTDGAGADRYTLWEFLELLNQNALYTVHQPKLPTDQGFIKKWVDHLGKQPGITIWNGVEAQKLLSHGGKVTGIISRGLDGTEFRVNGSIFLLAIPPKYLIKLLADSGEYRVFDCASKQRGKKIKTMNWNQLVRWEEACRYLNFIPITYHWVGKKFNTEDIWGMTDNTDWGIVFIVLSDYMKFPQSSSKTVISIAVTRPFVVSRVTKKTANQSDMPELLKEVFRQMSQVFPKILNQPPDQQLISPGVYRGENGTWDTLDTAFQLTTVGFGPRESTRYRNLYSVGSHNGKSKYGFTSAEAAIQNAVNLCHTIIPESQAKYQIGHIWTLKDLIIGLVILIIIVFLYFRR